MKELLHDDDVRRDAFAEGKEEGMAKGIAKGLAEGEKKGRMNAIQRLLAKGVEIDFIQSLDYSEEEILQAKAAMLTTL